MTLKSGLPRPERRKEILWRVNPSRLQQKNRCSLCRLPVYSHEMVYLSSNRKHRGHIKCVEDARIAALAEKETT